MYKRIFVFLALLIVPSAYSQMTPSIVNTPGNPLAILSTTATLDDFLNEVQVKNLTGRSIAGFQLGTIKMVAVGCGPVPVVEAEQLLRADHVEIAAGATVVTHDYMFFPANIANFASKNQAADVQTQLTVVKVIFTGGSTWTLPRTDSMYDKAMMEKNAFLRCSTDLKAQLARASVQAKCLRVGFPAGGIYYTCGASVKQICQNGSGATSCTSSFCTSDSCPDQQCQGIVVNPSSSPNAVKSR